LKAINYKLAEGLVKETYFSISAHGHGCTACVDQLPKKLTRKLITLVDDKALFVHFFKQGKNEGAWNHENHQVKRVLHLLMRVEFIRCEVKQAAQSQLDPRYAQERDPAAHAKQI